MARSTGTGKAGKASAAKTAVPLARQVRERVRKDLAPVARKTGKSIGSAIQATARAAGKTARIVALRARISARQLKIRGLFQKIGESFYRANKSGKSPDENATALRPLLGQVDKLNREIDSFRVQEKKIRAAR
jgi:hypothetical protein